MGGNGWYVLTQSRSQWVLGFAEIQRVFGVEWAIKLSLEKVPYRNFSVSFMECRLSFTFRE